ncbi:trans-Golgi network-localized SYP41-interacting protein 1 isoform X3 [Gossypium raimondii]|uniref:trans-Golgi network-localized SYP41-interacting protein 1 isoform X3 n=1 Tax=Gossypium raimondii TaxID=29730 RepID=UPI00063AFE11|nr:trans-Golgi network-localized SYP41-interacting protein 1 isoform X3 [Gossypium raimondii]
MDKNKSRTDMLAAGRQKLQQFRQKKDGKGSSSRGKSSKKSNKSDADAASSVGKPTVSSQVSEGETVAVDLTVSQFMESSSPSGLDTTAVVSSLEPSVSLTGNVETVVAHNAGVPVEVDSSVSNGVESTQCVDSMVSTEIHSSTADIPVSEGETEHNIVPQPSTSVDTVEGTVFKLNLVDSNEGTGQNPLFTALSQASGDQVTDIGAMQEADGLGLNQFDRGGETEFEIDGKLPLSEHGECAKSPEGETSEVTGLQGPSSEAKQAISRDDASVSIGAASSSQPEESFADSYQLTNKLAGEAIPCSHVDEKQAMGSPFGDYGDDKTLEEKQQCLPKGSFVSRDGSHERSHLTKFAGLPDPVLSLVRDGSPVRLPQLAEMIRSLDEDEYRHLLNLQALVSIADVATYGLALSYHSDLFEKVKEELYLTSSTKDIFYLQLAEQSDLHMQSDHHCQQLIDEISVLRSSVNGVLEKNACLVEELAQCRSELQVFASEREELQSQYNTLVDQKMSFHENEKLLKELADCRAMIAALQVEHSDISKSLALMTEERMKLEEEKELLALGKEKTALDLEEYKDLLAALQVEKSNLNGNLALVTEERKKLDEEKEYFVHENKRLASDLLVLQEQFATEHGQHIQLEAELKEVTVQLEKLIEENNFLNASLDVHKAKIAESESRATHNVKVGSQVKNLDVVSGVHENATEQEHSCQIPWKRDPELSTVVLEKALPDDVGGLSLALHEQEIFDESSGFLVLKEHLKEAERILQNLGMAIEQIHSHSMSLQQSSSKPVVPGVSKLIQAFESRVPHDEPKVEERGLTECQSLGDLLDSTKEITEALRAVLKLLVQDADNASSLYRGERNCRKSANLTFGELMVLHESLKEYSNNLEATNIELAVLYEAIKQHALLVEAKNKEFEVLYEALKQQESICSSENAELCQKLSDYQLRLTEMQGHFSDLQKRSDEMASDLYKQLESSQEEAAERALMVELEWKSKLTRIVETVRMLDGYVGRLSNSSFSNNSNDVLDTSSQVTTSVTSAINSIQDLQEKLEAANAGHDAMSSSYKEVDEKYNDLLRMNEVMTQILQKMYNGLKKLLIDSCALVGEAEMNPKVEKLPNLLDYSKYTIFIEQLENVLGERLHLQSVNDQLNSELVNRTRDFEEMSKECLNSNAIRKLIEHVENVVELGDYETDSYKTPGSRLELLVYLLVKKYKEIVELASDCRKEFGSKVIEVTELEEKMHQLDALRLQQELEIHTLKESLRQEEEALVTAHSELQEKKGELELSEQRVSSVREKLSIAVAKGKGLVVQRDGLKQSLAETSAELERCSQELQAKDARLQELEIKLKTYSEAGERVEALESELSYIRNSATALRESFLLKDSVLQRLEEILEELDLPEHFYSRDIIEKVDWLVKSTTDTWKEDPQQGSTLGEDLRRKYEDLQGKFYRLAERNEMLEQSLMERNHLLQKWEELLDGINMPSQMQSMEPEEKIEWLGRAFTEANHETNSLQKKIDNLENYYGSLAADLEGPEKRVADLEADLQSVMLERDQLSEKLETMTSNHHNLSAKAARFEVENENLQGKIYRLAERNELLEQSLMERSHLVQKWVELLDGIDMPSQMQSMEPEEKIEWFGRAITEANHERNSLQKKIDNLENYYGSLAADLEESEKRVADLGADLQSVTLERDKLSEKLETMTSNHHNVSAKAAHFEVENENLQIRVSGLQEELVKRMEEEEHLLRMDGEIRRLQHLISDVLPDADAKDLVSGGSSTACLERLLNKLIENYTNLKSMNPDLVDVEKDQPKIGDASLDEARSRDALTTEEDVASLKKKLEAMLLDLMQVKDERDEIFGKHQSLLHEVQALERKREELQELLNQEEQKSGSLREKLNLAVRKGKSLVQQRDSLKKTTEDMNAELERLKSEFSHRENALADYELKMRDFSAYRERVESLEADSLFLRNHLLETERMLEEKGLLLSRILNAIADIDVGNEINISDPVEKLELIEKVCHDLHAAAASSEQESRKSKTAAELLLAELNEVQERNDGLQEDLAKLASELTEVVKERDVAEAAKVEVLSRLEKLSAVHSEEKRKQYSELIMLQSSLDALRNGVNNVQGLASNIFSKDLEFLQNLEVIVKLCLEGGDAQDMSGWPYSTSSNLEDKENIQFVETWPVANMQDPVDDKSIVEVCGLLWQHLQDLRTEIAALKEKLIVQSKSLQEKGHGIWNVLEILHREKKSQKESFEAMRRNIMHLESVGEEKDMEILVLRRNIAFLYEACANSVLEIENQKAELLGNNLGTADLGTKMKPVILADGVRSLSGQNIVSAEKNIKTMADKLFSTVKDFLRMKAEITEGSQREMRITIANLQKELQEKDIQKDRICMELVSQIKLAEASSTNYSRDLQSSKTMVYDLEKELEVMREEQTSLQQRVKELENVQTNTVELQDRVKSLADVLSSKDQEIEALMQALDEEEVQMEELTKKIEELEKVLQQKNTDLENLEASRGKVMKKLSVTVSRFDELRDLSESLITKVEQLQSQLQDRDAEISFLRQEVTRCTNDVLAASQVGNKRDSDEINEFLTWLESIVSRVGLPDLHFDTKNSQVTEYKEIIQRRIISIISELENLREVAQNRDELLQAERSKVEELTRREETLKKTLHEKESQLNLLEGVGDVGQAAGLISEIVEVEPVINKRAIAGTSTASQVRSLRKVNTDQVAIPIDADDGNNSRLEDEDEDKVHGFKSLTTSRVVPRFTRPITDMIDGLWVSCDRALMRQPALRLGIIIYWALLHTLLGAFVF